MLTNNTRGLWRGKRVDSGEWAEGFLSKSRNVEEKPALLKFCIDYEENGVMMSCIVDPSTLGECTGLRDKNGKLIFEGDIVKAEWSHLNITNTVIGVVEYDNAAFFLETDDHYLFFEDNIFSADCDVIGNIHDSPELMNATGEDIGNAAQDTLAPAT